MIQTKIFITFILCSTIYDLGIHREKHRENEESYHFFIYFLILMIYFMGIVALWVFL